MMRPVFLIHLLEQHCNFSKRCGYRISQCPILRSLHTYNCNRPELEQIIWCARCDGLYGYEQEVYIVVEKKNVVIDIYDGGTLLVQGTQPKTKGYEFTFACDCRSGQVLQNKQGVVPYTLTDENRDWCYLQWRFNRLEIRQARFRENNPGLNDNPHLKTMLDRILTESGSQVKNPKPLVLPPEETTLEKIFDDDPL